MRKNAFTMQLSRVAEILGTDYHGEDVLIEGVSTDTRTLQGGELFVALRGENFDANDFAVSAIQQGASACLMEKAVSGVENYIVVQDCRNALAQLAKAWRAQFDIPVIAVTGSNGKTTVKEMIASILAQQGKVLATKGNLNNDIGVPLTIFRLNKQHDSAIIEMGANHPGEIAYLVDIANPDVGIVNNAAAAHLEGFGSLQGVARTKGEMFTGLNSQATAVINIDDQFASLWNELAGTRNKIYFGLGEQANVKATWEVNSAGSELTVSTPGQTFSVQLSLMHWQQSLHAASSIFRSAPSKKALKRYSQLKAVFS
ncbi:MAG: UDP-N-acetylmuramoyl-tripeptide--D-alanyl-D-alanine ligase [Gammaproteobacteria bacterium]